MSETKRAAAHTPETDAAYWENFPDGEDGWDFARAMERNRDVIAAERDRLRESNRALVEALEKACPRK